MKGYMKKIIAIFILISFTTVFVGCWDYDEISDIEFVGGMSVDKIKNTQEYLLTLEILKASVSSKVIKSVIVQSKGKTIHSAIRNAIKTTGKTLQMSHAKVVIFSEEVARDGVIPVLDLINRDVELRNDMWVLVSQMGTAGEIFTKSKVGDEIISYDLANAIQNSSKIGKYNPVEVFKLISDVSNDCISATIPLIRVVKQGDDQSFDIGGTAIFNGQKMVGVLDEEDTLILQLLKEKGLKFIIPWEIEKNKSISLELMRVTRKIKPIIQGNKISMDVNVKMEVDLSELAETGVNYVAKDKRDEVKRKMEIYLEKSAETLLEKLQNKYKSDVIGFGCKIKNNYPQKWKQIGDNWEEVFKDININVNININIGYSGLTNKNISVGK